jgi:hypothetical protein
MVSQKIAATASTKMPHAHKKRKTLRDPAHRAQQTSLKTQTLSSHLMVWNSIFPMMNPQFSTEIGLQNWGWCKYRYQEFSKATFNDTNTIALEILWCMPQWSYPKVSSTSLGSSWVHTKKGWLEKQQLGQLNSRNSTGSIYLNELCWPSSPL